MQPQSFITSFCPADTSVVLMPPPYYCWCGCRRRCVSWWCCCGVNCLLRYRFRIAPARTRHCCVGAHRCYTSPPHQHAMAWSFAANTAWVRDGKLARKGDPGAVKTTSGGAALKGERERWLLVVAYVVFFCGYFFFLSAVTTFFLVFWRQSFAVSPSGPKGPAPSAPLAESWQRSLAGVVKYVRCLLERYLDV